MRLGGSARINATAASAPPPQAPPTVGIEKGPWLMERFARLRFIWFYFSAAGPEFRWYARAYGFTLDELRYILDPVNVKGADYPSETFRVLRTNEIRRCAISSRSVWALRRDLRCKPSHDIEVAGFEHASVAGA